MTTHSDPGIRVYNSTAELSPGLHGIQCGPGGMRTEGENAVVIQHNGSNMLIYCMLKPPNYQDQREFRAAWHIPDAVVQMVSSPDLAATCRIF
jgi:hypothetical protein